MKEFIEIVDERGRRQFINVKHIEHVVEYDNDSCCIYMAFNCPGATEQDYCKVNKPYDEIVSLIKDEIILDFEELKRGLKGGAE